MKHYLNIALSSLVIVSLVLVGLDSLFLNNDARVMTGILTISGWMSLILFSASHSSELRRG
jgi:hypothetical protein